MPRDTSDTTDLGYLVDQAGDLKAKIADLTAQLKTIQDILKDSGETAIDGAIFRATVSTTTRSTLDTAYVKALLTDKQLALATNKTPVTTVRFAARKV